MKGETREIKLTKGQVALIDAADYEFASQFKWHALPSHGRFYAARRISVGGVRRVLRLHRVLVDAPDDMLVDHKNGDSLDNRRDNLRICTASENSVNWHRRSAKKSCAFRGVSRHSATRWRVKLDNRHLGLFADQTEAARAYDREALRVHGEFAITNFPKEDYR